MDRNLCQREFTRIGYGWIVSSAEGESRRRVAQTQPSPVLRDPNHKISLGLCRGSEQRVYRTYYSLLLGHYSCVAFVTLHLHPLHSGRGVGLKGGTGNVETKKRHQGLPCFRHVLSPDTVSDFIYLLVGCHSDDQFHISSFDRAEHGGV